jgi:hypothetical protein
LLLLLLLLTSAMYFAAAAAAAAAADVGVASSHVCSDAACAVGATNVGSIKLEFDQALRTNQTRMPTRIPSRQDVQRVGKSLSSYVSCECRAV